MRAHPGIRAAMGATAIALVLAACSSLQDVPPLVIDRASIFDATARAEADARLHRLAVDTGIWAFVISDPNHDPPRMLDEPMRIPNTRGIRAVAILFGPEGAIIGGGYSTRSFELGDSHTVPTPDVFNPATPDRTLAEVVEALEAWARDPARAEEVNGAAKPAPDPADVPAPSVN